VLFFEYLRSASIIANFQPHSKISSFPRFHLNHRLHRFIFAWSIFPRFFNFQWSSFNSVFNFKFFQKFQRLIRSLECRRRHQQRIFNIIAIIRQKSSALFFFVSSYSRVSKKNYLFWLNYIGWSQNLKWNRSDVKSYSTKKWTHEISKLLGGILGLHEDWSFIYPPTFWRFLTTFDFETKWMKRSKVQDSGFQKKR
jgi:hypothetical protein